MADFPGATFDQRAVENAAGNSFDATKLTRLYAEDILSIGHEIVAIEDILGLNPQGAYATVKAWLTALTAAVGSGSLDTTKFVYNQKPSETPDAARTTFTLPDVVVNGKLVVFADGIRLAPTDDYTFNYSTSVITFASAAPQIVVLCDYIKV